VGRCGNCAYWQEIEEDAGECRLNPPVYVFDTGGGHWPPVIASEWCGKFKSRAAKKKAAAFKPPHVAEVEQYCEERELLGRPPVDPVAFCDYYAARGWKLNGRMMKDWKRCVHTWENNSETSESDKVSEYLK
jgi:hypothetical protein